MAELYQPPAYAPVRLDDLEDPPRFGQPTETVKDAFVHEVREFFDHPFTEERRGEQPTVRKYAVGFAAGEDPYESFQQISQEYPDFFERMPNVTVTAVSAQGERLTIGRPTLGRTQWPPRVRSPNAEPYVLLDDTKQQDTVTVDTVVVGYVYLLIIDGTTYASYTAVAGDTTQTIACQLRNGLRAVDTVLSVTLSGSSIAIAALEGDATFTLVISGANMSTVSVATSGGSEVLDKLAYRTKAGTFSVEFQVARLAPSLPAAVSAADLVRTFNERAYDGTYMRTVDLGGGTTGVELVSGQTGAGALIEVMPDTTDNLLAVLGFGSRGVGVAGDTLTGTPPDTDMTLTIPAAPFGDVLAGQQLRLADTLTGANSGSFTVKTASASALTFENLAGVAESFEDATWFSGLYDDHTNPLRPPMERFHHNDKCSIQIGVFTEDANQRTELTDLVKTKFQFNLEEKFFSLQGRGLFDEAYPDEMWQISVASEVQYGGEADFPRPNSDTKDKIFQGLITIPCTLIWCIDRLQPVIAREFTHAPTVEDNPGFDPDC